LKIGIAVPAEHVHHIKELTEENFMDPNISLNPENLEALCYDCHTREHHEGKKYGHRECGREYFFDKDGNICLKK
jgi:5-methylcytosine-specific restriction endonuclease McrA